jgi:hypothetical protein
MNGILTIAIISVVGASIALGQTKSKSDDKRGNSVEKTLTALEQEMAGALTQGDADSINGYLADSFVFSAPTGRVLTKEQVLDDLRSGHLKMKSSVRQDTKVHVYGKTAVVTYRSTDEADFKGRDISGQYQWTDVFVNRKGKWQLVSQQGTPIPQRT